MSYNDRINLWCIVFSTSIFFLYYAVMRIKFPEIFKGWDIIDISKYIYQFNDTKIDTYKENKKYIRAMFFKTIDLLLSPYLFIIKFLDFSVFMVAYIIKWIFRQ